MSWEADSAAWLFVFVDLAIFGLEAGVFLAAAFADLIAVDAVGATVSELRTLDVGMAAVSECIQWVGRIFNSFVDVLPAPVNSSADGRCISSEIG